MHDSNVTLIIKPIRLQLTQTQCSQNMRHDQHNEY